MLTCCFLFAQLGFAGQEGIQVYQKNLRLSSEKKQLLADDIDRFRNASDLWGAIRSGFHLPHYENSPHVQRKIEWYLSHKTYLQRTMTRAAPYLYFILQQVKKRHLPTELALLPIIESAYNPFALNSSSGAAGIWQMMPTTASGYGIRQNWWYDGRRDVVASTKAALNHLSYLESFFDGNWILALAAYDTGEGNVLSAIRKNIRNGKNTDFWSLPLARETKEYVPQLLALATIVKYADYYDVQLPTIPNAPYLGQVDIGTQIDLKHAANLAGLSLKELKQLNPGYSQLATDPNGPHKLVLPIENVQQFTESLARSPLYQKVYWIHYKIKPGDSFNSIAQKFNTTAVALKKINPTLAKNTMKPGISIVIPRAKGNLTETILAQPTKSSLVVANQNQPKFNRSLAARITQKFKLAEGNYTIQPGDTLYMVRKGDTLQQIANKFHIAQTALATINKLSNNQLPSQGNRLIIPTHKNNPTHKYSMSSGDTIYMVRYGDTIEKIARKFNTSTAAIRLINFLSDNHIKEGDQLMIPTHV